MSKTKKLLACALSAVLLVGCSTNNLSMQSFKYHENAKRKPVVAMLPVMCNVQHFLPWDLSEELSSEIQRRLINQSVVYLNTVQMPEGLRTKLMQDDSVMLKKEDFDVLRAGNDFVALLELIEHNETPYSQSQTLQNHARHATDRILTMKMRVTVMDIRSGGAKTVLHEILDFEQLIPRDTGVVDYDRVVWGSDAYPATSYGRAHARLEKDVSKQIEKYISIAH